MRPYLIDCEAYTIALIAESEYQAKRYRKHYYPLTRWLGLDTRSALERYNSNTLAVGIKPQWRPMRNGENAESYLKAIGEID